VLYFTANARFQANVAGVGFFSQLPQVVLGEGDLAGIAYTGFDEARTGTFQVAAEVLEPRPKVGRTGPMHLRLNRQLDLRQAGRVKEPEQPPADEGIAPQPPLVLGKAVQTFETSAGRVDATG
jgi:hypothetical protein